MIVSVRATLYIVGAVFELGGIVLVGSPDLIPGAVRAAAWIRTRWRPIENRLRRLLRLRGRPIVVQVSAAGSVGLAGSVTLRKSASAEATLEQKVAFLLQRDQEAQRDVSELAQRVAAIEADASRRLDELRGEMKEHVARELTTAIEDYRAARIGGAVALAIGLALTTTGNFV